NHPWSIALIGVGNLGTALLSYRGFSSQGFHIVAAFDSDATKHGRRFGNIVVRPLEDLPRTAREQHLSMAIVAVPAGEAQAVVDAAVAAGIKGILNFAPVKLQISKGVYLEKVDLSIEIEYLSYLLTNL
ncbi:MAG: redox-sensing transcriptional repressor Rex, partial [Chloroflexota bacterium]